MEIVLAIAAIVVSVVAIAFEVVFFRWQTRQGERMGMSVVSTMDQIYRRIRVRDSHTGEEQYDVDDYDVVRATCTPKFVKPSSSVTLSLDGSYYDEMREHGKFIIVCEVERPAGKVDKTSHEVDATRSLRLSLIYPSEAFAGSTSEPGRYHVQWNITHQYVLIRVPSNERETHTEHAGGAEDSFGVMP